MKHPNQLPTSAPENWDKIAAKEELKAIKKELLEQVIRLRADGTKAILIVLQGMDASGKDGLTRAIFDGLSPDWVQVSSFKKPSDKEAAKDFLWRIHHEVPSKGMIGVFNRSHYEDILVPTVYKYITADVIEKRFDQINHFEQYLSENGVVIIKMFLNISKARQEEKLIERIQLEDKHYKHSDGDWETREHWDKFMDAYAQILDQCNTPKWHVIPCDKSAYRNVTAANIVLKTLQGLELQYPPLKSGRFNKDSFK